MNIIIQRSAHPVRLKLTYEVPGTKVARNLGELAVASGSGSTDAASAAARIERAETFEAHFFAFFGLAYIAFFAAAFAACRFAPSGLCFS